MEKLTNKKIEVKYVTLNGYLLDYYIDQLKDCKRVVRFYEVKTDNKNGIVVSSQELVKVDIDRAINILNEINNGTLTIIGKVDNSKEVLEESIEKVNIYNREKEIKKFNNDVILLLVCLVLIVFIFFRKILKKC